MNTKQKWRMLRFGENTKFAAIVAGIILVILAIVYFWIATEVFEWRHPKANKKAKWHHFTSVVTFSRVPELQEE